MAYSMHGKASTASPIHSLRPARGGAAGTGGGGGGGGGGMDTWGRQSYRGCGRARYRSASVRCRIAVVSFDVWERLRAPRQSTRISGRQSKGVTMSRVRVLVG